MSMKAIQILGPKTEPRITLNSAQLLPTAPDPPSSDQILIRVHAAGVTADEITWPEVYANPTRIPGLEVSGVVAELPAAYAGALSVGDAVYAMLHPDRGSGQAEYVYAREAEVARKPRSMSHAQAAALPIPALTAWEALFKRAAPLPDGARILVTGASGAVGSMVVQLAKKQLAGARVVALASPGKHEALRELGADETVDVTAPDWESEVGRKSVDAVFDSAGGDVFVKAWATVKDDGVMLTVADPAPAWAHDKTVVPEEVDGRPGLRYHYFIVSPDNGTLGKLAELIDNGLIKPLPVIEFDVDRAVEAWEFAKQRGRKGKVVINFPGNA